ncbi:hypothetical protein QT711_11295 [Sporosarcina saromensis]|uniref:Transglycosylase n=1 Tax=Sporosarcina saromensis TaxID=359365 RepID=A0ABU4G9V5_9BACL|nr:hypothetical protein [Sporosarcina saromensis]MDW0113773.1 hypothetical protein [Sporosarcina saromensis]
MNVQCDECKKSFDIKPRKKTHGVNLIETYFKCPHCKMHYTSFVTDQEVRRRQREMKELNKELHAIASEMVAGKASAEKYDDKLKEIETKKTELKKMMDSLKAQIASK